MGDSANQFNLSRTIPPEIRLQVRKACGFGCVICGASIIEYEHVDPEFKDARFHDPASIALLCASCHSKVTRRFWSKEKVKAALADPFCHKAGFSWGAFDFGSRSPMIQFSGVRLTDCAIPIAVAGTPVFQIQPPEEAGAPFRLSATFADALGQPVLHVAENEWELNSGVWDSECVGGRIAIRQSQGESCLVLRALPPDGIAIEKLRMAVGNYYFEGDEESLTVFQQIGGQRRCFGTFTRCISDHAHIGMQFG